MKFKFITQLGTLVVDAKTLEKLLTVMSDCEVIEEVWVGDGKGFNGSSYNNFLRRANVDKVSLNPIMDDTIEALRLATKLNDEAKAR